MRNILHLTYFFFIVSCGQGQSNKCDSLHSKNLIQSQFEDTKWERKLNESCINYLEFEKGGVYVEFNCELGETWEGEYKIQSDTIILIEKIYTSDVPDRGTYVKNEYKYFLSPKGLYIISSHTYEDGVWHEHIIDEPSVFYIKTKD